MSGLAHRWLVLPLRRGALPVLILGGCYLAALLADICPAGMVAEPAARIAPVDDSSVENRGAWPRVILRLWFLAPQILPQPSR